MSVCGNCVKFGVEVAGPKQEVTGRSTATQALERRAKSRQSRDIYRDMEEELIPDYGEVIRKARERKGMTVEDLGAKILERVPVLQKVEKGALHPPDSLVKKLEKELDVKLMEKPEAPAGMGSQKAKGSGSFTIGDLIKDAQKKQGK